MTTAAAIHASPPERGLTLDTAAVAAAADTAEVDGRQRLEREREIASRLEPRGGILLETSVDDALRGPAERLTACDESSGGSSLRIAVIVSADVSR